MYSFLCTYLNLFLYLCLSLSYIYLYFYLHLFLSLCLYLTSTYLHMHLPPFFCTSCVYSPIAVYHCIQAVLVDMEEGVVSEMLKGPLRDVFDHQQLITDVSGSGNNWWVACILDPY